MQFTLTDEGDGVQAISIVVDGQLEVAISTHPAFEQIVAGALAGDDSVIDLFDASLYVAKRFEDQQLGERVQARNGRIYLDGDELHNSLAEKIVDFLQGGKDWNPLVKFLEKVITNSEKHSEEQLFDWLENNGFALTPDGDIVCYKGVQADFYSSTSGGKAFVDGKEVTGKIPNNVGSIIEMPRSSVNHNPSQGCSVGLHAADFDYASGWSQKTLRIIVNPRDVVSVPTDCSWKKMRVCRYYVDAEVGSVDSDLVVDTDFVFDREDTVEKLADAIGFSSEPVESPSFS